MTTPRNGIEPADSGHTLWVASGGDRRMRTRGFGPFVTQVEYEGPDGSVEEWTSRSHRKHAASGEGGSTWWAPGARGWWMAVLFAVGSFLFALGAVPGFASLAGTKGDAIVFFTGSVFFTCAAFLQYREVVDTGPDGPPRGWRRLVALDTDRIDWWASTIQLAGTLFFNVSTGVAVSANLSSNAAEHHVWRPDALGSICFLVASAFAWFEVCHAWGAWLTSSLSWWIALANLIGSIAFGVSAVAAYIVPSTGALLDAELSNLGTFIGALCFLGGAILLCPERTESSSTRAADVQPAS